MKKIVYLLVILAGTAGAATLTAGTAHADVRTPITGTCTTTQTVAEKDGVLYRTHATYCDGQAKPVCVRTYQVVSGFSTRFAVLVRGGGYYQCPVTDIASRRSVLVR